METSQTLERDYLISTKLLDADGVVVAQHDSQPQHGQRPTSGWQVGELIYSPHEMTSAEPLPAGEYQAVVQVYYLEGDTVENVGSGTSGDSVYIDTVRIE